MDKMMSIQEASKMLGVTVKTLKLWDIEGKLKAKMRTVGGHRRYSFSDLEVFLKNKGSNQKSIGTNVYIYCRVSTKKQKDMGNLERQKERLSKYCKNKDYTCHGNKFLNVASIDSASGHKKEHFVTEHSI